MQNQSLKNTKFAEYIRDFTAIGNPFLLLLVSLSALSMLPGFERNFGCLVFGFFINEIVCSGIKFFWHKPRPNGQKFENGFEKIDAGSFPSIHASRMAFVYFSLSYLHYQQEHYLMVPVFLTVILIVGYSRTFLKKHFWLDVFAGFGFGFLFFLLFFILL
jgi:membrane-associated phospholipid phosphatase